MDMGYSSALNGLHNSQNTRNLRDCNTRIAEFTQNMGGRVAELDAGLVIDRMQQVVDVRTDIALGSYFGYGTSTVSGWRLRNKVPFTECVILAKRKGVSLDWLIHGIGEATGAGTRQVRDAPGDERIARLHQFLDHWDATSTTDDKVWLEMQLARSIPEYAEWIAARGK